MFCSQSQNSITDADFGFLVTARDIAIPSRWSVRAAALIKGAVNPATNSDVSDFEKRRGLFRRFKRPTFYFPDVCPSTVSSLLLASDPTNVSRFIAAGVIRAVNLMLCTRCPPHASKERLKTVAPLNADGDSSGSVPPKIFVRLRVASSDHPTPGSIFLRKPLPMSCVNYSGRLLNKAPAGFGTPVADAGKSDQLFGATDTLPKTKEMSISGSLRANALKPKSRMLFWLHLRRSAAFSA